MSGRTLSWFLSCVKSVLSVVLRLRFRLCDLCVLLLNIFGGFPLAGPLDSICPTPRATIRASVLLFFEISVDGDWRDGSGGRSRGAGTSRRFGRSRRGRRKLIFSLGPTCGRGIVLHFWCCGNSRVFKGRSSRFATLRTPSPRFAPESESSEESMAKDGLGCPSGRSYGQLWSPWVRVGMRMGAS